jgi:hypothetical protein
LSIEAYPARRGGFDRCFVVMEAAPIITIFQSEGGYMAKYEPSEGKKPRRLSLQVPQNTNLAKMSDDEIEKLALEMSRKMAATLPKGTELQGIEGVTLNQGRPGIGVEVSWSRACARADLSREGLVVNPQMFVDPFRAEDIAGKSARITFKQQAAGGAEKPASKKKQ